MCCELSNQPAKKVRKWGPQCLERWCSHHWYLPEGKNCYRSVPLTNDPHDGIPWWSEDRDTGGRRSYGQEGLHRSGRIKCKNSFCS